MKASVLAGLLLLTPFGLAQQADGRSGTVPGTVTCADTHLPGRLTNISLTPVRDTPMPLDKTGKPEPEPMVQLFQTHLDGTFTIPRVTPGRYYLIAQKPGYLSPAALFTKAEIDKPSTPELAKEIADTIPVVTVAAGQTTNYDISLRRAASVGGTIRFDDGSPGSGLSLSFYRKTPESKWVHVSLPGGGADDLGHFRVSGLPAGEYRMSTGLSVSDTHVSTVFSGSDGGGMWMNTGTSIPVYYGDTFFRKDATMLKLDDGQDATADITIPVSKLHSVSGTLVDARTGRTLNAGTVEILEPGSTDLLTSVTIDADDPTFRLEYVPEGQFTVRVSNARLVSRQLVPMPPGSWGTPSYKETVLQTYEPYESQLTVTTDLQGVTLPIVAHGEKARP